MIRRLVGILVVAIALFVPAMEAGAQSLDPRISVRVGVLDKSSRGGLNTFYPEVEVENRLHTFEEAKVTLNGSVFAGYWNAGADVRLFRCEERVLNRCQRNLATGLRLRAMSGQFPLSLFGEWSYHVRDEIDNEARVPVDRQFRYMGAGGGIRLDIPLFINVRFVAQWQAHLALTDPGRDIPLNRSLTFGLNAPL